MPTSYEYYLNNQDDRIADQKRLEQTGKGVLGAFAIAGTVAGFVLARQKIAITKSFSKSVKTIGKAAFSTTKGTGPGLSRYIIKSEIDSGKRFLAKVPSIVRSWTEALAKPLPALEEQYKLAKWVYRGYHKAVDIKGLPKLSELLPGLKGHKTLFQGPAFAAIAPKAGLGLASAGTSGKYGGIITKDIFHEIGKSGDVVRRVKGIVPGIPSLSGRIEASRRGLYDLEPFKNITQYVKKTIPRRGLFEESQDIALRKYIGHELGLSVVAGKAGGKVPLFEASHKDLINFLNKEGYGFGAIKTKDLLRRESKNIKKYYKEAINKIVSQEVKKPSTQWNYSLYKYQMKLGVGAPFARYMPEEELNMFKLISMRPQKFLNYFKSTLESGYIHPVSDKKIPWSPVKYLPKKSLTGLWPSRPGLGSMPGEYFATESNRNLLRSAISIYEGTMFKIPEELLGFGITARRTALTDFVSNLFKVAPESWTGYAIRRQMGSMPRMLGVGFGAYYGFRLVNYMARQATGGWGVTDVAGKAYTSSREFQQRTLDSLGLIKTFRDSEKAFPGLWKSPASRIARMSAPFWMMGLGKKVGGLTGAKMGLAMGTALALITWGDITQSPEELHEIYTGERDIPIRKGRYWPFGKTPLGGGKIMYWRPHWYPMMRSRYRHRGQLWDSETEELAQGTLLSPILAPIMQGRMWDPYYWEKKHYHDRPYPMTGELFEPTMPFAWLGNLTLGNLIKPQRPMHPEYWGEAQQEAQSRYGVIPGGSGQMGVEGLSPEGMHPTISPDSLGWNLSTGAYSLTKQMGLRGYLMQQAYERITGRPQFLPEGPVVQASRRATGYQRQYWDLNIGDPGGTTEFFRRILPQRRKQIEEWNPIPNVMPDWLPGPEYYLDFRHGDPYTKIEMGEARLPGPGYESLHRLRSGIPGVYDAVDRFLILADVAPYSDQYNHYKVLAMGMTRGDKNWRERVTRKITQRAETQKEYEFLDLEPPEDVTGTTRILSKAYRRALATVTGTAPIWEKMTLAPTAGLFAIPMSPVAKLMPYRTAIDTYKQDVLYGRTFTTWAKPMSDFIMPWVNNIVGLGYNLAGHQYIPGREKERREYEEYFDRLEYVKQKRLAGLATMQNNEALASRYEVLAGQTMAGLNTFGRWSNIYRAMPKHERNYFQAFADAPGGERDQILDMVPRDMQKLYKSQWNISDGKEGLERSYDVSRTASRDVVEFFKTHYLPDESWVGWHPDVDMDDVKLKVVKQEGKDIHDYNMWWSDTTRVSRRPYVPTVDNIYLETDPNDMNALRRLLYEQLAQHGLENRRINITRTASPANRLNINFNIRRNREKEYQNRIVEYVNA